MFLPDLMKGGLFAAWLSVALLSMALSGCVSDGLTPAERSAPAWEPGYTWTYQATTEHSFKTEGSRSAEQTGRTTTDIAHVVAAAATLGDEPVYWVRTNGGPIDGPILYDGGFDDGDHLVAYSQASIVPVAYVNEWDLERCSLGPVRAWARDEPFGIFDFPLVEGKTWEAKDHDFHYEAEVAGTESVKTPDGTYDAARIDIKLSLPEQPAGPEPDDMYEVYEEEVQDFRGEITVWYAPEVRNIVRFVSSVSAHIQEGDESFTVAFDSTIELKHHALVGADPEELPEIVLQDRHHPGPMMQMDEVAPVEPLRVVSDADFPLNLAEDAKAVRFGLAEGDEDVISEEPRYDTETSELRWIVRDAWSHDELFSKTGPVLEVDLVPGIYWIEPRIESNVERVYDPGCDPYHPPLRDHMRWIEQFEAEVFWEQEFDIDVGFGESSVLPLATMPTGWSHGAVTLSMSVQNKALLSDDPEIVFKGPERTERFSGGHSFMIDPADPAEWEIEWHPNGFGAQTGEPRTIGHTATVRVSLEH